MSNLISLFLLLSSCLQCSFSSSSSTKVIFSLWVDKNEDVIHSPNGAFSAGFIPVGDNAFSFAVWFTGKIPTVVWMANRDFPVNGHRSTLSILNNGNVILNDAAQAEVWSIKPPSGAKTPLHLNLSDNGNLVLWESQSHKIYWQSFDFPTDTLLPGQPLTRYSQLVSSRSSSNQSSGFYKLFFDNDNVLRLLYDGRDISAIYWPDPWVLVWNSGRSTYNSTRVALLDSHGIFNSSDNLNFLTSDYGTLLQRRLKIDPDGNLRVYSRAHTHEEWYVSWQAKILDSCKISGICGANSVCSYHHEHGKTCSCVPGYKVKNQSDWSFGCEPKFHLSCHDAAQSSTFKYMPGVEFYGYDNNYKENITYEDCKNLCLQDCNCKAFQHSFQFSKTQLVCYTKSLLFNGQRSPDFEAKTFVRLPKGHAFSHEESIEEWKDVIHVTLNRGYNKSQGSRLVSFFLWCACAVGACEVVCILVVWCLLIRTRHKSSKKYRDDDENEGYQYQLAANRFRKFSYSELKEASKGFKEEIGRGGGGIVYKGVLSDKRVVAIKRLTLNEANQGEVEFLAEVTIIGRLNHMNLIEMLGYCAEGKHRLLVYEYMENGSLAQNLCSSTTVLDWKKRYNIALSTARGLAYLHEECLEWILHCDIKPQNILLDSNYEPKVADFGLSKLVSRNDINKSSFSRIRGTRGYMAPEWVFNFPITSKVDVYSYGIVVLEMITGKCSATGIQSVDGEEGQHQGRLVTWVREKMRKRHENGDWVKEIIDPVIRQNYDSTKMGILAQVALECVEEEKDLRPTMRRVVEVLQSHHHNHS